MFLDAEAYIVSQTEVHVYVSCNAENNHMPNITPRFKLSTGRLINLASTVKVHTHTSEAIFEFVE